MWASITELFCLQCRVAPPDPSAINIRVKPGIAFGSGEHPTTQMCLSCLRDKVSPGAKVLDYGSGSGILTVAACLFGADKVVSALARCLHLRSLAPACTVGR
jgi:ribosomal protein L11 methylase PrmA